MDRMRTPVLDERNFPGAFRGRLCRLELDRGVDLGERALGRMALRTPVIVGHTTLDPVGYQSPGEQRAPNGQVCFPSAAP